MSCCPVRPHFVCTLRPHSLCPVCPDPLCSTPSSCQPARTCPAKLLTSRRARHRNARVWEYDTRTNQSHRCDRVGYLVKRALGGWSPPWWVGGGGACTTVVAGTHTHTNLCRVAFFSAATKFQSDPLLCASCHVPAGTHRSHLGAPYSATAYMCPA